MEIFCSILSLFSKSIIKRLPFVILLLTNTVCISISKDFCFPSHDLFTMVITIYLSLTYGSVYLLVPILIFMLLLRCFQMAQFLHIFSYIHPSIISLPFQIIPVFVPHFFLFYCRFFLWIYLISFLTLVFLFYLEQKHLFSFFSFTSL